MENPYYNANSTPVVQGEFVSTSTRIRESGLNHSINGAQISDTIARKRQDDVDAQMSYYAVTKNQKRTFSSSSLNLDEKLRGDSIPHGQEQRRACRDAFWAILFYSHLIVLAYATFRFVPTMASEMASEYAGGARRRLKEWTALQGDSVSWAQLGNHESDSLSLAIRGLEGGNNDAEDFNLSMSTIWAVLGVTGAIGFLMSSLAMTLMMAIPTAMIKVALGFNLIITGGACVLAIMAGVPEIAIMAAVGLLITIYYTYVVWRRIPFAASTLVTALTAVKCNMGLAFFAYNNLVVTFLWNLWWSIVFAATFYVLGDCNAEGYCENEINGFLVFLFLVSAYWTTQIIKNIVHVTVAGTVGTWWFVPGEARSCCSPAVQNSYWRSVTTSFGSICFGSLIVAILQATKAIVRSMRKEDNSLLLCLIDCILHILERIAEYFNKWAFVYVGLYGYGFTDASVNVLSLFKARGWTSIIADYLVDTVLLMVSICVGVITGIIGAALGNFLEHDSAVIVGSFLIGCFFGFILCNTLFGLVSSAVNAVIVCFAEAPAEFESNHPILSHQMILAWREAYPNEFVY